MVLQPFTGRASCLAALVRRGRGHCWERDVRFKLVEPLNLREFTRIARCVLFQSHSAMC